MMNYEIEKRTFGSTWVHVIGENEKKETMTIEIVHCENPGGNNSLPYAWYKNGWTDKIMETYIGCNTYVHDSEGGCYGGYNVTEKRSDDRKLNVINFDWLLEDTEENRKKIIEECIKLFENAKGKSATEKKMEHIMEVAKERNLEVVYELPEGWKKDNCMTDPWGATTICNGQCFIKKENGKLQKNSAYKRMLLVL